MTEHLDAAQKALPKLIQKVILAHAARGVEDPFRVPGAASSSADGSKKKTARGDANTLPVKNKLKAHIMELFKLRCKQYLTSRGLSCMLADSLVSLGMGIAAA